MLVGFPPGTVVLDVPVGTGRFLDHYAKCGFVVIGVDRSQDMLNLAQTHKHQGQTFYIGDVRALGMERQSVDIAVACRITRWLSPEDCQKAIRELMRVARKRVIFTARVANHPHARPLSLFEAMLDGWYVACNEAGYHEDYRIIALEPIPGSFA